MEVTFRQSVVHSLAAVSIFHSIFVCSPLVQKEEKKLFRTASLAVLTFDLCLRVSKTKMVRKSSVYLIRIKRE